MLAEKEKLIMEHEKAINTNEIVYGDKILQVSEKMLTEMEQSQRMILEEMEMI